MAFLTLEDRYAEIEVIVFANLLGQYSELLTVDSAVAVTGELTVRDDEAPRLMLRSAEPLRPNSQIAARPSRPPVQAEIPAQYLNDANAPAKNPNTAEIPAQYLNAAGGPAQNPNAAEIPAQYLNAEPAAATPSGNAGRKPGRLFVRVESMDCEACRRAVCLTEIFDGPTPVIFYDLAQKKYLSRPRGIDAESCVGRELEELLGKNNVVWK